MSVSNGEIAATIKSHLPSGTNVMPVLMGFYVDKTREYKHDPADITGEVVHGCWRAFTEKYRPDHPGLETSYGQLPQSERDKDEPFAHAMRSAARELKGRL